jgi:cell wall-associated NlpC family hydrolase
VTIDHRLTPARPDLADSRLEGIVPAERYTSGTLRRVSTASAPLRRRPAADAPLDTEAQMGELVRVYDEREGWAWGQLESDGYVGYLPSEALGDAEPVPTHKIRVLRTFVYPAANLKLPSTGFLGLGAAVAVTGIEGEYARLASGAFIFAAHFDDIGAFEPDFVAVAERLTGTPYLWGGRTTLGIDCSGLVQIALAAAGIPAPRDSDMQEAALGEAIPVSSDFGGLRRGDLVFWKGHVGIMLDGERLLHANGHHMLTTVEPLSTAEARIRRNSFGPITAIKRLPALGAPVR